VILIKHVNYGRNGFVKSAPATHLRSAAVGDDEIARVLGLDVGAVQRDGAATRVRHLRLAAVVRQLEKQEQAFALQL
jgi:hypothetical protein